MSGELRASGSSAVPGGGLGGSVTVARERVALTSSVDASSNLTLGVENVFDKLYRGHLDPSTLYRPGRNFFVRVSRSF